MNDLEKAAQKGIENYNNMPRPCLEDVYVKAQLTSVEISTLNEFRDVLEKQLVHYAPKWLCDSSELNKQNIIKHIAGVLGKCTKKRVSGDLRVFLKKMFSNSMDYGYKLAVDKSGYRIGPKSDEFDDIFFELEIIDFLLDRNFNIDLEKTRLGNGKNAEFWAQNDETGFYIEAKNINFNGLQDIIFNEKHRTSSYGMFNVNDDQQREIRKIVKSQLKSARQKFSTTDVNHSIYINIGSPLGTLGKKLIDHINKMLNSQHSTRLIYIGIFTRNKIFIYDRREHKLETILRA